MPSSPNLIFIFLGRGFKKSEYSSNSKLHDFKLDTLWDGGWGWWWKVFGIWCNHFLRKISNISFNFFPKNKNKNHHISTHSSSKWPGYKRILLNFYFYSCNSTLSLLKLSCTCYSGTLYNGMRNPYMPS